MNISTDDGAANNGDEADTSLSCAENRASTGTQCFESEFPDEDSDIEISYSREDLDTTGVVQESYGFKPIQSSSEELGAEATHQWRSQFSVESDPNGYELDLGAISPPSDIEEQSLASTAGEAKGAEQDAEDFPYSPHPYGFDATSSQLARDSDPYGFKLSPEPQEDLDLQGHAHLETVDMCTFDGVLTVLEAQTPEIPQVSEHCGQSSQPDLSNNGNQQVLEPFDLDDVEVFHENQEVLDLCSHEIQEVVGPFDNYVVDKLSEPPISSPENQEVLDLDSRVYAEFPDSGITENREVLISQGEGNQEVCRNDDTEVLSVGQHDNQEGLELWSKDIFPEANNNQCVVESKVSARSTSNSSDSDVDTKDLLALGLDNSLCPTNRANTNSADSTHVDVSSTSSTQDLALSNAPTSHRLLEGDLGSVFGAGGYIGCPDVADDLEPLGRRHAYPLPEPVQPIRPVRPPRPSLRVSWNPHI
ncbi:unnamed protein product [Tetraodon nigroviridis]|uniref:(spotted green pufferfish) hypothetical protein n=1 Tax=Tetraodon nigroviridis TaxID=99883 RepID=Q4SNK3_TETNG|nr:unnamed protein product [Tetraodon nigroviridis]